MSARGRKCPGCGEPKSTHSFGTPGKQCDGRPPSTPSETLQDQKLGESSDMTAAILQSLRGLSERFQQMEIAQSDLKEKMLDYKEKKQTKTPPGTYNHIGSQNGPQQQQERPLTDKQERAIASVEYIDCQNCSQQGSQLKVTLGS